MANNRIFIVNERLGIRLFVGVYFPSTGWEVRNEFISEALDEAFRKDSDRSLFGPTDWAIEYETHDGVSDDADKANILLALSQATNDC